MLAELCSDIPSPLVCIRQTYLVEVGPCVAYESLPNTTNCYQSQCQSQHFSLFATTPQAIAYSLVGICNPPPCWFSTQFHHSTNSQFTPTLCMHKRKSCATLLDSHVRIPIRKRTFCHWFGAVSLHGCCIQIQYEQKRWIVLLSFDFCPQEKNRRILRKT